MSIEFILIWLAFFLLTLGLSVDRMKGKVDVITGTLVVSIMTIFWAFFLGLYLDDRLDHIQAALDKLRDIEEKFDVLARAIRGLKT